MITLARILSSYEDCRIEMNTKHDEERVKEILGATCRLLQAIEYMNEWENFASVMREVTLMFLGKAKKELKETEERKDK